MQEIARDVYEAMEKTRPAEARVWQEWIENGEARIVDPELAPAPACTRCGATVRVEARFCQQCGLPLTTDALLRWACDMIAKDAAAAADDPRVIQAFIRFRGEDREGWDRLMQKIKAAIHPEEE